MPAEDAKSMRPKLISRRYKELASRLASWAFVLVALGGGAFGPAIDSDLSAGLVMRTSGSRFLRSSAAALAGQEISRNASPGSPMPAGRRRTGQVATVVMAH